MGVHSGRFAVIDGRGTAENWSLNLISTPQPYVASNTAGGRGRIAGIKDWNGAFQQRVGYPVSMPGDVFTFKGYGAPDDDVLGSDGAMYSGSAIIDQIQLTWNWETNEPIMCVSNFSGNGALTETSDVLSDATSPAVQGPTGLRFTLGADEDAGSDDDLCTSQATITITADNQPYVNACTGGWTKRKAGPIDWNGQLQLHNDSGLALPFEQGDDIELWAYVTETTYWIFKWAHIEGFTNIVANRSGEIIGMTVPLSMNGFVSSAAGQIRKPGAGSDWWPFS